MIVPAGRSPFNSPAGIGATSTRAGGTAPVPASPPGCEHRSTFWAGTAVPVREIPRAVTRGSLPCREFGHPTRQQLAQCVSHWHAAPAPVPVRCGTGTGAPSPDPPAKAVGMGGFGNERGLASDSKHRPLEQASWCPTHPVLWDARDGDYRPPRPSICSRRVSVSDMQLTRSPTKIGRLQVNKSVSRCQREWAYLASMI